MGRRCMLVIHKVHLVIILAKVLKTKNKIDLFPVGFVLLNMSGTNPGQIYAGTWELCSKGRAIIGVDPDNPDYNQSGLVMGEKEHTLTVQEMPSHGHASQHFAVGTNSRNYRSWEGGLAAGSSDVCFATADTNDNGGGQPHNNIPPSMTLYIWQRVA